MWTIYGGSRPHIGGSVIAVYHDQNNQVIHETGLNGHKENDLFIPLSVKISQQLKQTTSIVGGIHYADLSKDQIDKLVELINYHIEDFIIKIEQ